MSAPQARPRLGGAHVVTGGGRGIGRATAERLLQLGADAVAVVEADPAALGWAAAHPGAERLVPVHGDAADQDTAERAAEAAQNAAGTALAGWVNNAAVFRDASLHRTPARQVMDLIGANLAPAVAGCAVAVRRMSEAGAGAIVNVSSHQARQAVPGCAPYATAKAAVEGLTRALAVEYGPHGVRVNAVALGSVATERYAAHLAGLDEEGAGRVRAQMGRVHPLGRIGTAAEAASAIAHLLSPDAGFITGATVPVDGGRTVLAHDPEAHETGEGR
ncbi:SDR family NAD(P)-dependent oxidoreductase [Nocardiopsis suaedae]|uniref:SDR family NAD(P)-dependent oxidoreductase n=1 Tax=Nocardiopsis suaedae TaxID=3018444 RepID=A0ABT4TI29_9ACTN|nr:SDR family oxidoreductase [Nocardiopsis suaedae]MDA2804065.1 SDR family NAD(P)-dependent oxidoreductase [Nocardiopsis suaedae]